MAKNGVDIDTFEIGNEIDFWNLWRVRREWPAAREVSNSCERKFGPRMVPILKAAQAGVLKPSPRRNSSYTWSQWNNVDYCIPFWKAMLAAEVQLGYPGSATFPLRRKRPAQRPFNYLRAQVGRIVEALHKPVLICETGYPAAANFGGQFAEWNLPTEGYPLSDDGQAQWIADLVALIRQDRNFAGVFYLESRMVRRRAVGRICTLRRSRRRTKRVSGRFKS